MKVSNDKVVKAQRPSRRSRSSRKIDQGLVTETVLKLFFSFVIGVAGLASLIKLVPYHNTQQAKLKELRAQVKETKVRVFQLREELNRNFDPQQTQSLIEEYSSLTAPNRIHIFVHDEDNIIMNNSETVSNPQGLIRKDRVE
ncbi:MAG: hypothetical protein QNJ70_00400 [Xenococcaceae cyanobacterium MO_207.B15]|nr:hypothetical protein [Xenococcaceae cyanobacterium MO_207.B15]MDJ0745990.1 hypothetical protein [Xenococcaceae cyanobacterium MO_167.B27]